MENTVDKAEFSKLVEQDMLFDKKTLAELLALKELSGRLDVPVVPQYPPSPSVPWPYPYPVWPNDIPYPWWPQVWYTTTSNGEELKNCSFKRDDVVRDTNTNDTSIYDKFNHLS